MKDVRHRIQQFIDGRWCSVAGLAETEQVFGDADTAQSAIDELRQYPMWTMAQLRTLAVAQDGE